MVAYVLKPFFARVKAVVYPIPEELPVTITTFCDYIIRYHILRYN
jgi:hypothetical protein